VTETDEVLVEHQDGIVITTINRASQRNDVTRAVS
jgi:enoyl-CoA hydratase/carnithine racemase